MEHENQRGKITRVTFIVVMHDTARELYQNHHFNCGKSYQFKTDFSAQAKQRRGGEGGQTIEWKKCIHMKQ